MNVDEFAYKSLKSLLTNMFLIDKSLTFSIYVFKLGLIYTKGIVVAN